jgi:hypothetical protein
MGVRKLRRALKDRINMTTLIRAILAIGLLLLAAIAVIAIFVKRPSVPEWEELSDEQKAYWKDR